MIHPPHPAARSDIGKSAGRHRYLHLEALDAATAARVRAAAALAGVVPGADFNVVKLEREGTGISLLDYPEFLDTAFPVLRRAWRVDPAGGMVRFRDYAESLNPPILHRKELLLPEDHPRRAEFTALTQAAEAIGLFDDPTRIGFQQHWEALLARRGYRVAGHALVPVGNAESGAAADADEDDDPGAAAAASFNIARHRTALSRSGFSAPIQALARFGFLDGGASLFDYGCGRGDDLRGLLENGIEAAGWDPHFAPDRPRRPARLVNLGFVINVIEDRAERLEALRGAYALAEELLVVAAMIAHPDAVAGTPYGDGILTSRRTFQKYYRQEELRDWLAESLAREPWPVGPGVFFVFKDPDAEQRFLLGRRENRRAVRRLARLSRPPRPAPGERPARPDRAEARYLAHRDWLEALWEIRLALGRDPDPSELPGCGVPPGFSGLRAALRCIAARKDHAAAILDRARAARIDSLRVYLAESQFQRRPPYRRLEAGLQRDIKAFFGDYRAAVAAGRELLFAAGDPETLATACREAAERGLGWLEPGRSLQLPTRLLAELPAVLRAYVACGLRLHGDPESADLIKIHIQSGKLTLMSFDDFAGRPLPRLLRRVKLKLRSQDFDLFEYGDGYPPPYLYRKSRYLNEEFPHYAEQRDFDEALENLGLLDFEGHGPGAAEFDARLAAARWTVEGFRLARSRTLPDLDAPCGRHFRYRDLIHCGETQARTGLPNLPRRPETWTALRDLAAGILDPVIDYFGMIRLTYGFCSAELAKHIPGRVAPALDQHAGHEPNRLGRPICPRLGAAVDFLVEDEDMAEVARWIMANLPHDRLYYYGPDRPIHVSHSENPAGEAWEMREVKGKRVPRRFG